MRAKRHTALRGMKDIMPEESYSWQKIESTARYIFHLFGYREIRTPILEERNLFVKSIGNQTDIVRKEMFSFKDRGQREVALRPEGTAPIIRAYLENNLYKKNVFQKLYYIGAMFRSERPQRGRFRQFHHIGAEAIGSFSPFVDAEMIALSARLLDSTGIEDYTIRLNNLGCREDKKRLSSNLKELLSDRKALLCQDCKVRLKTNPLRILDCKKDNCKNVIRRFFKSVKFLCQKCTCHFDEVKGHLDTLNIPYHIDPYIVRGLDYYTRTVFEVTHPRLGAQDAIGAGGRYDNLTGDLGGPELGACGFALGFERMLIALGEKGKGTEAQGLDLYLAPLGKDAYIKAFKILNELRGEGISSDIDYEDRSLRAKMRMADRLGARLVAIIGEDELKTDKAILRDMTSREQVNVDFKNLIQQVKARVRR